MEEVGSHCITYSLLFARQGTDIQAAYTGSSQRWRRGCFNYSSSRTATRIKMGGAVFLLDENLRTQL